MTTSDKRALNAFVMGALAVWSIGFVVSGAAALAMTAAVAAWNALIGIGEVVAMLRTRKP